MTQIFKNNAKEYCYLTAAEVADFLGVKLSSVQAWCRKGILPAIKFGGQVGWRIEKHDLEDFIQELKES